MTEVRLPPEEFLRETERLVAAADARGAPLRVCGSVGLYHAIRHDDLASRIYSFRDGGETPRIMFKDLDLAAREKHGPVIYRLFVKEIGYLPASFSGADRDHVLGRLREYRTFLRDCPKTRRWEKRRAKGTKEPWYEPVDEVR